MANSRFHRQELLFGAEGQAHLASLRVALVGLGGLGSHVAQQLAYLGVQDYALIDRDRAEESNLNRLVGANPDDAAATMPKVDVAWRMITTIEPAAKVRTIRDSFIGAEGFEAIRSSDVVIGGMDRDGARLVLNEACAAYDRPYLDIATDVDPEGRTLGGRVIYAYYAPGVSGCVYCLDALDQKAVDEDLETELGRGERERMYGVRRGALGRTGPAVVSLNGVLASLAVTELMRQVTGLGQAHRQLVYRGDLGTVRNDKTQPPADCYYCLYVRGRGAAADVERYIRAGLGERL